MRLLVVDDRAVAAAIRKLPPEVAYGRPNRTFLKHLLCTWRILADWRMPVAVCRAGFMHSVYSTSYYPHAIFSLERRDAVKRMIGEEAEDLVYRFCSMDRRGFWDDLARRRRGPVLSYPDRLRGGARVRVSRSLLSSLLFIESANLAEQGRMEDDGPAPWMSRAFAWWKFLEPGSIPLRSPVRPRLTAQADKAAVESYRLALDASAGRAAPLLERAARQNPWAGEPRILRALCARDAGERRSEAQRGAALVSAWAVAWDKRLSVAAWQNLAQRIQDGTATRRSQPPDFERIRAVLAGRARPPRWLDV